MEIHVAKHMLLRLRRPQCANTIRIFECPPISFTFCSVVRFGGMPVHVGLGTANDALQMRLQYESVEVCLLIGARGRAADTAFMF
jgi:hypothetical protein